VDTSRFLDAHLDPEREEQRNRLVSFVYQNMEFETVESLGDLIAATLAAGQASASASGQHAAALAALSPASLAASLDLGKALGQRPQALSKGELQRGIIALAVAYGSPILMMDEPVFALEERHKQQAFGFLRDWCRNSGTHLVYTAHDIHLCRDFADSMLLLSKDKSYKLGPVAEVCTDANLEAAYRVPLDTLYQKEGLYRDMLLGKSKQA
jgi:ABC-type cobalamin/Fe3+-siderophores transport system ATPase subunit